MSKLRIFGALGICLACFGAGYIGGYFTPSRDLRTFQPDSSAGAGDLAPKSSWRAGPCPIITGSNCPDGYKKSPPVLFASFDGFGSQYMERIHINAFKRLQECGVHATSMRPSYPTITYPNYYGMVTGLFSESHGIVDNKFYDPVLNRQFVYNLNESMWFLGEPIWVTAKKMGKRTFSYYFGGTEAKIKSILPDVSIPYVYSKPDSMELRVDTVLDWLSRPDGERPDLTLLYFGEPDAQGHAHGIQGEVMNRTLTNTVNSILERLMQGLHDRNLLSCVNVILVSDHGMQDMTCDKAVHLQPIIDNSFLAGRLNESDYHLYGGYTGRLSVQNLAANVTDEDIYNALACKPPINPGSSSPYQIYRKKDLPRRFHYSNTPRVEPTILTVQPGRSIHKSNKTTLPCKGGDHGYDNLYPSMQAIFQAQGPSFKSGLTIEPFQNIELYNLMCDLLNVEPAPNNGTYGSLHHVLRTHATLPDLAPGKVEWPVFPGSVDEMRQRQGAPCWAVCPGVLVQESDSLLNISRSDTARRLTITTPYGVPQSDLVTVVLANKDYALGFDPVLQLPAWTSFTTSQKTEFTANSFIITCARNDVRLLSEQTLTCKDFSSPISADDLQPAYLFPPELATTVLPADDVHLVTNVVPMYATFRTGIWAEFWRIFGLWSAQGWKLNVVTGPVFDSVAPYGLVDAPEDQVFSSDFPKLHIPSHYFAVVTRDRRTVNCVDSDCLPNVLAFILPHTTEVRQACQDVDSYILTHSATVRDVERVTGLRFYPDLPQYETIRLRTQLPTRLWHKDIGL